MSKSEDELRTAIEKQDLKTIKKIFNEAKDYDEVGKIADRMSILIKRSKMSDLDEMTAAIEKHDLKTIKKIFKDAKSDEEYEALVDKIYKNGESTLSYAIENGTPKIVLYLLIHRANPFLTNHWGELCLNEVNIKESIIDYMMEYYENYYVLDDDTIDAPEEEEEKEKKEERPKIKKEVIVENKDEEED